MATNNDQGRSSCDRSDTVSENQRSVAIDTQMFQMFPLFLFGSQTERVIRIACLVRTLDATFALTRAIHPSRDADSFRFRLASRTKSERSSLPDSFPFGRTRLAIGIRSLSNPRDLSPNSMDLSPRSLLHIAIYPRDASHARYPGGDSANNRRVSGRGAHVAVGGL
jgi:hypothetical protein